MQRMEQLQPPPPPTAPIRRASRPTSLRHQQQQQQQRQEQRQQQGQQQRQQQQRQQQRQDPQHKRTRQDVYPIAPRQATASASSTVASCAECASVAPCTGCSSGKVCQQIFEPQGNCQTCPTNVCVATSSASSSSSSAGMIAGPVVGALGIFAIASVVLFFWWRRNRARTLERARIRSEAKSKDAKAAAFTLRGGPPSQRSVSDGSVRYTDDPDEAHYSIGEIDVDAEELEDDMGPLPMPHRFSTGAATHLSKITEGDETEDAVTKRSRFSTLEEMEMLRSREPSQKRNTNFTSSSSSIEAGIPGLNGHARSRKSRSDIANPFETEHDGQESYRSSFVSTLNAIPIAFGGPTQSMPGQARPYSQSILDIPAEPAAAHRPVGAPLNAVSSNGMPRAGSTLSAGRPLTSLPGSSPLRQQLVPERPLRDVHLNLRLPDGTEPGRPGADLKPLRRPHTAGSPDPQGPEVNAGRFTSSAPVSPFGDEHSVGGTVDSVDDLEAFAFYNDYAPDRPISVVSPPRGQLANQSRQDTSSPHLGITPPHTSRPLSIKSTMTTASDYVLSDPQIQIVTRSTPTPIPTSQPTLVRSLSEIKRQQQGGQGGVGGGQNIYLTRSVSGRTMQSEAAEEILEEEEEGPVTHGVVVGDNPFDDSASIPNQHRSSPRPQSIATVSSFGIPIINLTSSSAHPSPTPGGEDDDDGDGDGVDGQNRHTLKAGLVSAPAPALAPGLGQDLDIPSRPRLNRPLSTTSQATSISGLSVLDGFQWG